MKRLALLLIAFSASASDQYGYMPIYTTAGLPTCDTNHIHRIVYDSTQGGLRRCTGTEWTAGLISDSDRVDITVSANSATWTINPNSVALGTDTTGNYAGSASEGGAASTATALAADGSNCTAGNYARGVDVSGNAQDCTAAAGGGDALVANPLSQFASTTSAQLAGVISNETGTGLVVLDASPALSGNPTAPTAAVFDNDTSIATTAFVQTGGPVTVLALSGDHTESETSSMAEVTGLNKTVGAGTYVFEYYIRAWAIGDAAQSLKFAVNHTGTTTVFFYNMLWPSAGVAAATGAVDQDAPAITTGSVWAHQSTRTKNTTLGPQTGVDTAGADVMYRITGLMIVTVSGDLELYHGSELTQANGTTVKAGTCLVLTRVL